MKIQRAKWPDTRYLVDDGVAHKSNGYFADEMRYALLKFHEDTRRNRGLKNRETCRVGEHRLRNPPVRTTSPTGAENKRICRQRIGMQTKINRCYVLRSLASRIYSSDYSIHQNCTFNHN